MSITEPRPTESYRAIRQKFMNPPNAVHDPEQELWKARHARIRQPVFLPGRDDVKTLIERAAAEPENTQLSALISEAVDIVDRLAEAKAEAERARMAGTSNRNTVRQIQRVVARYFGQTRADIIGKDRHGFMVYARHIAIYLTKELLPETSTTWIGRVFGGKDHTTILHALRKAARSMESDEAFRKDVETLKSILTPAQVSEAAE